MLCLEIAAPENRVLEILPLFFKKLYRLTISAPCKIRGYNRFDPCYKSLIIKIIAEFQFRRAFIQQCVEHIFEHIFRKLHVVL